MPAQRAPAELPLSRTLLNALLEIARRASDRGRALLRGPARSLLLQCGGGSAWSAELLLLLLLDRRWRRARATRLLPLPTGRRP
jgi:hypothetical protein